MSDTKPALLSSTILSALVGLVVWIGGKYGFVVDEITVSSVVQDVAGIVAALGVIRGRLRAVKRIEKVI